jgi:hypothetical protein
MLDASSAEYFLTLIRYVVWVFDYRLAYILYPLPRKAKYIDNQKTLITMMRMSTKMAKAINDQISYEASSANAYIAIGSWCERIGYDGSAAFFFEQAAEENGHMLKLIHYLNGVGAEAIIPAIEKPPSSFESLESHRISSCMGC